MSGGNRLFHASLRGCLTGLILAGLVWPLLAQEGKRGEQHPGRSQAEAEQTPAQPPTAPAVSTDRPLPEPNPKNYWNPCTAPEYGNESDLCQQWRMAEAAEETADWTLGQILVTGVEVVLIAIAIGIAWRAGYWAKLAALAGAETVEVTRTIGKAQTRAYVASRQPIWEVLMAEDLKKINGFSYSILWENCGTTPARRCRSHAYQESFDGRIPDDFDYPDKPVDRVSEKSHIGPKKDSRSIVGVSVADAQAAERGEKHIFVWAWIEYDDIFPETPRHRTEVCVELIISNGGRKCVPTITGPFNGADEDCHHKPKT